MIIITYIKDITSFTTISIAVTDVVDGVSDVSADRASRADARTDQSVVLRRRDDRPVRVRREDSAPVAELDRRDDVSSLGQESRVGLGETLGDEQRGLEMRDLGADDDLGSRSDVREVNYDYIFGNDVNDDDDEMVIVIITTMAFVARVLLNVNNNRYFMFTLNSPHITPVSHM